MNFQINKYRYVFFMHTYKCQFVYPSEVNPVLNIEIRIQAKGPDLTASTA
jgi:hypothetical protein